MPELESVVEQKTAGFVDTSYTQAKRKSRIEQEERELEELVKAQQGGEEEDSYNEVTEVKESQSAQQEDTGSSDDDTKLTSEEKSFKKRYGDLRSHTAKQQKEFETRITELEARLSGDPKSLRAPKSDEDIEQWASKYPDVAAIVETIATKKAKELFSNAEERLAEFDKVNFETERVKSENTIREAHKDFDELRQADSFHDWASEQPKWVQNALYENSDDPASVIRVIDLYKVDTGKTPSDYKRKAKDAAKTVSKGARTSVDVDNSQGTFKESNVAKMSFKQYEDNAAAIDEAIRSGKFIYDLSGGAR